MVKSASILSWALLLAMGTCAVSWSADAKSPEQSAHRLFDKDTVYNITVNLADTSILIAYGGIALVSCKWHPVDGGDLADFVALWNERKTTGWQTVQERHIWAGAPAVSDTVIGVVAKVSSVDPSLIRRVLPERFEIILSADLCLRVMTHDGATESRPWSEVWRGWAARWTPFHRRRTLDLIVSLPDAQTLYYAFEPGTPVVLAGRLKR
ncbi:MAG: hypothetical protein HY304_05375 [candidate division Zixibacteria bacterium]|nr:hypothetical protein [candidate division Zixibacteria bacterium]